MIDIKSGNRHLKLTPYERIPEPEECAYDLILVWVEFLVPGLKTEFTTEFSAGQLELAKEELQGLYQSLKINQKSQPTELKSSFNQVVMSFQQSDFGNAVGINLTLRPENHADSVTLTDFFGIDESYFPALLSGLDEMINWQS